MNTEAIRPCDPNVTPRPTTVPTSDPGPWAECSPLASHRDHDTTTTTAPEVTTTTAPELVIDGNDTYVIQLTGPVTPFTQVGDASSETVHTYDIGTPPTLPPPPALPQTGTSSGLLVAATVALLAGLAARRGARRAS